MAAAQQQAGLCFVQDVGGGQVIEVCRIAGYSMPSFVFWASLMIALIFAVSSALLLYQCFKLGRTLTHVAEQMKRVPTASGEDTLSAVRKIMEKQPLLSLPWNQFEETLLLSPTGKEVYTTQSVENQLSKSILIDENVHSGFYNAVPGILTGVGLLMTFVAILDGLSHVSVSANMDVQGIGGLINGLSGKFVSSIVAVTCAVFFVFIERIAYSQPQQAYRTLIGALSSKFKRKTTEHLLYELHMQLVGKGK